MDINEAEVRDFQIYQAVQEIRKYIEILITVKEQQSNIADKLSCERMIEDLSMAIFNLESRYNKTQINY
jgi:hypothetical protein